MARQVSLFHFQVALAADNSLYRFGHDHADLVRNIVRSKTVPVWGTAELEFEPQRIEHWVTLEADIDVLLNRVSVVVGRDPPPATEGPSFPVLFSTVLRRRRFNDVAIDDAAAQAWLRKNVRAGTGQMRRQPGPKSKKDKFLDWYSNQNGVLPSQAAMAETWGVTPRTITNWLKDQ